jgi:hypothetical protein
MALNPEEILIFENPKGSGSVFKGSTFIADVDYNLKISREAKQANMPAKQIITGSLRRIDRQNIPWGVELFTLYLQDKRKLDFICVSYTPDCEIASDGDFY